MYSISRPFPICKSNNLPKPENSKSNQIKSRLCWTVYGATEFWRNLFIHCWNVSAMVHSHCEPLQTGVDSVGCYWLERFTQIKLKN